MWSSAKSPRVPWLSRVLRYDFGLSRLRWNQCPACLGITVQLRLESVSSLRRNSHLAWAFVEAANFALRFCPEAKRFYERKKARTNTVVAIKALAHKLARACFHILKERKPFDVMRCFA